MRILFITILGLCIFSNLKANTIFYLTKIPNLKIYELKATNGIKYLAAEKPFKVGIVRNNVQCDVASEFNRLLPKSELFWIENCGHAPMMEHPLKFNSILKDWLKRNKL